MHAKRQSTRFTAATLGALIWTMLILGLYYWVHKPITPPLARAAGGALLDMAVAAVFALAAGGLGRRLLRRLDLTFLNTPERLATTGLIGLGTLSLLIFAVGAISLSPLSMIALLAAILALTLRDWIAWAREGIGWLRGGLPADRWQRFLALTTLIILLIALILATLPPTKWDALTYHLTGPQQYVEHGRFYAVEHNHFLGFPQLVDTLYAGQLALTGRLMGSALIHWVIGVLVLLAVGGYAARRSGAAAGWVAVNIILAAGTFWMEMTFAYSDLIAMGLVILALIFAERWAEMIPPASNGVGSLWSSAKPGLGYLLIVGLSAGFGMSTKYTVIWLGVVLGLLILWLGRRAGWRMSLVYGVIYGVTAAAVVIPWLVRDAIWYHNPVYPMAFQSAEMDTIRQDWYSQPKSGLIYGSGAWQIPVLPITATFLGVEGAANYSADIGPLFLILTPLALLAWAYLSREEKITARRALLVAGVLILIWIVSAAFGSYINQRTRFVLYSFSPLAVVGGITLEALRRLPKKPFDLGFIMRALVALTLVFMVISGVRYFADSGAQLYFSGEDDYEKAYLEHSLDWYYVTMEQINELPEGTTVRFLWEPRYLYCDDQRLNCYTDSLMDAWYYARRTVGDGSPAAIAARWQSEQIDYLLVAEAGRKFECGPRCDSEDEGYTGNKLYDAADWEAWDAFVQEYLVEEWHNGSDDVQYILYGWRD